MHQAPKEIFKTKQCPVNVGYRALIDLILHSYRLMSSLKHHYHKVHVDQSDHLFSWLSPKDSVNASQALSKDFP